MACGLTRQEALSVPLGEVLDLAAIYQYKLEGARLRRGGADEDMVFDLLTGG